MKPQEIKTILKVAKELGVKDLSVGGLTVTFFDKRDKKKAAGYSLSPATDSKTPAATPSLSKESPELTSEGIPTEDEFLLMSTHFYDQLQAAKRHHDEDAAAESFTQ
jgi:hypothetical protein